MEYGTKEFYMVVKRLMAVVIEEGEAGQFTQKGVEENGAEFLHSIVRALEPFGIIMTIRVEPIEDLTNENTN